MQPIEIGLNSAMASREHPIRQAGSKARQGAGTPKGWATLQAVAGQLKRFKEREQLP